MKRVLVGVLSADEPTLDRALAGIASQTSVSTELVHIAGLPKREAHRRLYATFTQRSDDFDFLVKVDADMELVHPRVFAAIGEVFDCFPPIDLVPVAVDDWLSGQQIWSLNAWRGGVRWTDEPPELFTDQAPNTARGAAGLLKVGRPLVIHAAHPSATQSLRFGAHRALKAASTGKADRLDSVERLVQFCRENPTIERRLVIFAVDRSLQDKRFGRHLVDALPPTRTVQQAISQAVEVNIDALADQAIQRIREVRSSLGLEESARLLVGRHVFLNVRQVLGPLLRILRHKPPSPAEVLSRALQG